MYLIGGGRVLIYATGNQGEKIYLSSLTEAVISSVRIVFHGGPTALTWSRCRRPRSNSTNLYDKVMYNHPEASRVLLRFYKDRIVDTILARSPVFGILSAEDRRGLIDAFQLRTFEAGRSSRVKPAIKSISSNRRAEVLIAGDDGARVLATIERELYLADTCETCPEPPP